MATSYESMDYTPYADGEGALGTPYLEAHYMRTKAEDLYDQGNYDLAHAYLQHALCLLTGVDVGDYYQRFLRDQLEARCHAPLGELACVVAKQESIPIPALTAA